MRRLPVSPLNHFESREKCPPCAWESLGTFEKFSPAARKAFEAIWRTRFYPSAAILFVEGQPPRGAYLLGSGRVKLAMSSAEGKSIILHVAGPGELLGLSSAISGQSHEISAETLEPCQVNFIRRGDFCRLLQEEPEFSLKVIEQLSRDYFVACGQVRTFGLSRKATEKVARFLLDWAARDRNTTAEMQMTLPLTHEEIAQAVGLTRETVTRTLADFKHRKLILTDGPEVVICNRPVLESLSAA